MRRALRPTWMVLATALVGAAAYALGTPNPPDSPESFGESPESFEPCSGSISRLQLPTDSPPRLSCNQAQQVAAQAREYLAELPMEVEVAAFAQSTGEWLDPHGFWSAAPDSPIRAPLRDRAPHLLATLQQPGERSGCRAAHELGQRLVPWIESLRAAYGSAASSARIASTMDMWEAAHGDVYENGPVTQTGPALAMDLGVRMATLQIALGSEIAAIERTLRARLFPELSAGQWAEVVLAASLRAYLFALDPHGAWAPLDEETSLYEVELEASGRGRMWTQMSRTAVGLRVDAEALAPLQPQDVVVAIGGVPLAGLSVEQADQLGVIDPLDGGPPREVVFLRNEGGIRLRRAWPELPVLDEEAPPPVSIATVPYAEHVVAVLGVREVADNLGDELAEALATVRSSHAVDGVVLDLRGNGGGSIDGAKASLGLFLPGATLFPMRRQNGSIEVEVAPEPPATDGWSGPLAALVDAETASAAEMIAGVLSSYRRGIVLGARTYGKGCVQEYLDDAVGVGVLRVTTLLYTLPDGTPVQGVGLQPDVTLLASPERRPSAGRYAPWYGPDVRAGWVKPSVPWPAHGGRVGPCQDETVCRALRTLGSARRPTARRKPRPP